MLYFKPSKRNKINNIQEENTTIVTNTKFILENPEGKNHLMKSSLCPGHANLTSARLCHITMEIHKPIYRRLYMNYNGHQYHGPHNVWCYLLCNTCRSSSMRSKSNGWSNLVEGRRVNKFTEFVRVRSMGT